MIFKCTSHSEAFSNLFVTSRVSPSGVDHFVVIDHILIYLFSHSSIQSYKYIIMGVRLPCQHNLTGTLLHDHVHLTGNLTRIIARSFRFDWAISPHHIDCISSSSPPFPFFLPPLLFLAFVILVVGSICGGASMSVFSFFRFSFFSFSAVMALVDVAECCE